MNMKHFRQKRIRCFALLLAVGLAVQVLAGTVFAAAFTDSGSIESAYREAVEQMTGSGVLSGFPDGSFRPKGTLTREQGAKIVAYMVLGSKVNALTCEKAPFTDVKADRWSAPCIAWCVEEEILQGYGDGRYGPEDTLTGDQFAKMLLCALHLARDGSYIGLGSIWYTAVREDAETAGLYAGDASMETSQPITRQQAALMAWNVVKPAETSNIPGPNSEGTPEEGESNTGDPDEDDDNETSMMTDF